MSRTKNVQISDQVTMLSGVTRPIDDLGRIVLPKEMRDVFNWQPGMKVEVLACEMNDEEVMVVRQHHSSCMLCRSRDNLHCIEKHGRNNILVCSQCVELIIQSEV